MVSHSIKLFKHSNSVFFITFRSRDYIERNMETLYYSDRYVTMEVVIKLVEVVNASLRRDKCLALMSYIKIIPRVC